MISKLLIVMISSVLPLSALAAQPPTSQPEVAAKVVQVDRYPAQEVRFPGGVVGKPGLVYWEPVGYRSLALDLYLPPESLQRPPQGFPLILYVHGGGWMGGDRRRSGPFVDFFRRARFAGRERLRRRLHRLSPERRSGLSGSGAECESGDPMAAFPSVRLRDQSCASDDMGCVRRGTSGCPRRSELQRSGP